MKRNVLAFASVLWAAGTMACSGPDSPAASETAASLEAAAAPAETASVPGASDSTPAANVLPLVVVHKSPQCGCCTAWVEHMRSAGFEVEVRDTNDLDPIKRSLGVPSHKASCHTAQVGDYFVEGHVPADDVKRLLAEKPHARGLAVPGMPAGSPGMAVPAGHEPPSAVDLVAADGTSSAFAHH